MMCTLPLPYISVFSTICLLSFIWRFFPSFCSLTALGFPFLLHLSQFFNRRILNIFRSLYKLSNFGNHLFVSSSVATGFLYPISLYFLSPIAMLFSYLIGLRRPLIRVLYPSIFSERFCFSAFETSEYLCISTSGLKITRQFSSESFSDILSGQ